MSVYELYVASLVLSFSTLLLCGAAYLLVRTLVAVEQLRLSRYQVDATLSSPTEATSISDDSPSLADMEPRQYEEPEPVDVDRILSVTEQSIRRRRRGKGLDEVTTMDENSGVPESETEIVGGTRLFRNGVGR